MLFPIRGAPALRRQPWVTLGLIAVNLAIFLYQSRLGPQAGAALVLQKGAVAAKLSQPHLLFSYQGLRLLPTMFSSLFLHGGWVHLVGNMWFLWIFGEALEDDLGHGRFLAFYLFCGFFAGLFHVLWSSQLRAPLIGASGAIAGVLGGYLRRLPQSPIHTLILFRLRPEMVPIPAFVWLGLWLVLQFYGLRQGGPVAWMAHLGGFFIGLVTVNYFTPAQAGRRQPARKSGRKAKGKKQGKKQELEEFFVKARWSCQAAARLRGRRPGRNLRAWLGKPWEHYDKELICDSAKGGWGVSSFCDWKRVSGSMTASRNLPGSKRSIMDWHSTWGGPAMAARWWWDRKQTGRASFL